MANNAKLTNPGLLIQAGINPKNGLPIKFDSGDDSALVSNMRILLRIKDEQDAINRFTWYNLPNGLTGQLLERILYYKAQGCFFYMPANGRFYFLPYTLQAPEGSTGLDVYGRYTGISPICFNGTSDNKKDRAFIPGLLKIPHYEVVNPEIDDLEKAIKDGAVILRDYSNQLSETNISRQILNDPLLNVMSEMIPMMRTSLLNDTGIQGMKVETEDESSNVVAASNAVNNAAVSGKKWIPIVGHTEFQELTGGVSGRADEFLLAMQSLDNFRLSLYGLQTGGLFQKKEHMLQSEQDMNSANASLSLQDGLTNRQRFCDIVNSIWGLGIWCEPSEMSTGNDQNMDGDLMNEQDQSGTMDGEQPQEVNTNE